MKQMMVLALLVVACVAQSAAQQIPPARIPLDTVITVTTTWRWVAVKPVDGILRFSVWNSTTDTVRFRPLRALNDTLGTGKSIPVPPSVSGGSGVPFNYVASKAEGIQYVGIWKTGTAGKIIFTSY